MAASLPDPESISAKGTTLLAALAFVEVRWGEAGVLAVREALDADTAELTAGAILASSRYPLRHLVRLCETIDTVHGSGDLKLCQEIGYFSGGYEIRLLHKLFLRVLSLDYWFRLASVTWKLYYNMGELRPQMTATSGRLSLSHFNPLSKAFCHRFSGWIRHSLELSRLKDISVHHTQCLLDGAPACVWDGTWEKR